MMNSRPTTWLLLSPTRALLLILLGIAFGFLQSSQAAERGAYRTVLVPSISLSRAHVSFPTEHSVTFPSFGASLISGYRALSAEASYQWGKVSEDFVSPVQSASTTFQSARLGLRSDHAFTHYLSGSLHAGYQGTWVEASQTTSGVTLTAKSHQYRPYAGLGLGLHAGAHFSLIFSGTMTINSTSNWSKNPYDLSVGPVFSF